MITETRNPPPASCLSLCLPHNCQRKDSEVRRELDKPSLLLIITLRGGLGKIAAPETSGCWIKPIFAPSIHIYVKCCFSEMFSSQSLEGSNYTKIFWKFSYILLLCGLFMLCLLKGYLGPGLSHVRVTTIPSCVISAGVLGRRELRGEIKAAGIYQAIRTHCQGKRRNWG